MKNLTLFLLLVAGLTFTSCSDDEATPDTPFITATVAGSAFTAATIEAASDDTFGEAIIFTVGTNAAADISIGLNIPASVTVDESYEVDASDIGLTYGTEDEDAAYFTVGTVTVTAFDTEAKSMRGTFSFTATNSDDVADVVTVAGGEFFVEYQ